MTSRRRFLNRALRASAFCAAWPASSAVLTGEPRRIRIGQIGTAHGHAEGKMAALRRLGRQFEVAGIAEPDPERRALAQAAAPYGGLRWMTVEELLAMPGLDAVNVETGIRDLVPTAERAIDAGKHVHLDKPAGESLPAFERLLQKASARQLSLQMGYMFRYNPGFEFCFRAIREGWLGALHSIEAAIGKVSPAEDRAHMVPYRGGVMFELGCHLIDAVVRLLGAPQRVAPFHRHSSRVVDPLLDNQLAVLEYPNALATVRASVVEVEGFRRRHFVVCGEHGTLEIRPLEPPSVRLALAETRGEFARGEHAVSFEPRGRYEPEFMALADAIGGKRPLEWDAAHDLVAHRAILEASGLPTS